MILTRIRPSLYLSGLAVAWGIIAACMAATQNWHQIAGLRLALGAIEAGFAPGCAFYLSSWYVSIPEREWCLTRVGIEIMN